VSSRHAPTRLYEKSYEDRTVKRTKLYEKAHEKAYEKSEGGIGGYFHTACEKACEPIYRFKRKCYISQIS